MINSVENLGKLERRLLILLSRNEVKKEVEERLRKTLKKFRMPGFRPGKAPIQIVRKRYSSEYESQVIAEKVEHHFLERISGENLHVVGKPRFELSEHNQEQIKFQVMFEVYPEVKIGDISSIEVEEIVTDIGEDEVNRTLDILRKQRASFRESVSREEVVVDGDRVTVDLYAKIENVPFNGGIEKDFIFVIGGNSVPSEFESTAKGMKLGERREFNLVLSRSLYGEKLAGKIANFCMTLKRREIPDYPRVDSEFAKSIGIRDGDVQRMRSEILDNLEREAKYRIRAFLKNQVMNALLAITELEVPNSMIMQDQERLAKLASQSLDPQEKSKRKEISIPIEMFKEQAERRVKLGLILFELSKCNDLKPKPSQIDDEITAFAKGYEDPKEVIRWYYSDQNRLSEVEALVVENNAVEYVLGLAKIKRKHVSFENLVENTPSRA